MNSEIALCSMPLWRILIHDVNDAYVLWVVNITTDVNTGEDIVVITCTCDSGKQIRERQVQSIIGRND